MARKGTRKGRASKGAAPSVDPWDVEPGASAPTPEPAPVNPGPEPEADPDWQEKTIREADAQASAPEAAEPAPEPVTDAGSFNAFAGKVEDEARPPDMGAGLDGIEFEEPALTVDDVEEPPAPDAGSPPSDASDKPKRKRKRSDDPEAAPHDFDEYVEFANDASHVLDLGAGIAVHAKLDKYVSAGVVPADVLNQFADSLDLSDREREKLSRVTGRVLEKEKIKLDPMYNLITVGIVIALPRIQAVKAADAYFAKVQADGGRVPPDANLIFKPKGEKKPGT